MKITDIRFGMLRVPLKTPFKTALRSVEQVEDVVVMVHTDSGHVGYGSAPATAVITGDTHGSIVEAVRQYIAPRVLGQDIAVRGSAGAPYPGNPQALRRCLDNLIENAVRYGGGAEIEVIDEPQALRILVCDRGPGIPQSALQRVFEPYYRLDASRNPARGGVGLGLSIARNIARAHGGDIALRNRPEGGLVAEIALPRIPPGPGQRK